MSGERGDCKHSMGYQGPKADYADAHNKLRIALVRKGQMDEAIRPLQRAIDLNPDYAGARNNLRDAFPEKGQTDALLR